MALAHAEIDQSALDAGERTVLVLEAVLERPGITNQSVEVLVPSAFEVHTCRGPADWTCERDAVTHAPHEVLVFSADAAAQLADIAFFLEITTPTTPGTYLLPTIVTHSDGWIEPWAYAGEPFPAPVVTVDDDTTLRTTVDAPDAPCFSPEIQPALYQTYEGDPVRPEPCPQVDPALTDASPSPAPPAEQAAAPIPTPTATPGDFPRPSPTTALVDDPATRRTDLVPLPIAGLALVASILAGAGLGFVLSR